VERVRLVLPYDDLFNLVGKRMSVSRRIFCLVWFYILWRRMRVRIQV